MLIVLALLSMVLGNVDRDRADRTSSGCSRYSTIANMGFMLMGFLAANPERLQSAAMFYAIAYVLTSLASFGMVMLLSRAGFEADQLDDFKGLNQRSPWWAFMMLLVMFSLAGIPPTVGFYAKFTVIEAAVNAGFVWLAVVAVLTSLDRRVLLPARRQARCISTTPVGRCADRRARATLASLLSAPTASLLLAASACCRSR